MSGPTTTAPKWPKPFPTLTAEQVRIRDDFMRYWHEYYPETHTGVARWCHTYPLASAAPGLRTLDIGAGVGEHLEYEAANQRHYVALEMREEMAAAIEEKYPEASTIVGDIEVGLDVPDASFDRIVALHVLEHLRNLPAALDEIRRILKPGGVFEVVIPCEGGLGYAMGRRVTSQRVFERRYDQPYGWYIRTEHVNVPSEVVEELEARFVRSRREWWPLKVPSVNLNLCIGLSYRRA